MSIGVATLLPDENDTVPDLVERADRALYHAKSEGRNRAVSLDFDPSPLLAAPGVRQSA